MSLYRNKSILIIGGTGTIGQHLLKELLQHSPKVIRIFSRDEHKQFELHQDYLAHDNIRYLIGDVRDERRLSRAMEDIDYVFHLAAMKHVPACEYNPFEAVQTNVLGTQNVIQAAVQNKVKRVLFTSTDKAISPTNTYGATKLTAERLISAAEYQKGPNKTIFSSVRFGNVMGSRGSVIPLFKKQILNDKRITLTNANMLRYMMTPNQAIQLILKANSIALGGEVFVLKMPIIKMQDLVEVIIEEMKDKCFINEEILIDTIGLRPGEKRYEELMTEDEYRISIETKEMYILPPPFGGKGRKYKGQLEIDHCSVMDKPRIEDVITKRQLRDWICNENLLY
ncbi:polysaccharide biosynthesis protein [Evansella cellulosilytica]|uniref:Polysaccharide biosynthesis protein CapD n=1 Tax=Evansella cellulosilytica (strain ATCC 21833 / DSM 2522 / FERM P-1141 / JCM 9156 / N-4) TaxID=649639 RepID=E6TS89_EVAC2|nr:polysaccharide biosynthesis protein [Evansella cellulosilytica]ADU31858.1 polysaccharide biosynthesis protein CapD [Evansella cellulosilytica DSM 2522]